MINIQLTDRSRSQGYEWSIKSWSDWSNKNDCELFVLSEPIHDVDVMKPNWHKMYAFDLLDNEGVDYDQILFVDSDTIVHPNSPNFFDLSDNKFCAVRNYGSMDWVCRSIENYSTYLFDGYLFPYWRYINSGFMIFNKQHKNLFRNILEFYFENKDNIQWVQNNLSVGTDQPVINFFLNKENIDFKLLPYEFNMQDMNRFEVLGEDMLHTEYGWVYHFNAGVKPTPEIWMEKTYEYLTR